jgi:outer membrane cobalamin receptor
VDYLTTIFTNSTPNPKYQDVALSTYSFFLQDTQDILSKQTQFTAGVRFDVLDLFHNQFNYRLGLTHAFDNGVYAKLLYGTAYRAPSFVEFTRDYVGIDLPDVEKVQTLEGQIGYQSEKMRLSLTGYRNSYNNVLQRRNSFNTPNLTAQEESGSFKNFDHQTIIGAEFEAAVTFDENWKGFLNTSWSKAESRDAQQKLPLLADWTVATGLEWSQKIYAGDLVFNNQLVIYGKRKDWQPNLWQNSNEQRFPNRPSSLNDGFATWNSSLHYRLPVVRDTQRVDFDLSAYNLLNKTYYTQSLTPPRTLSSDTTAYFDTQYQGRQVRFSVSYSW